MKKIKFESLDKLSGLDLTTIAYFLAFLIALFTKATLMATFFCASALCAFISFKKGKVSLTVLNGVCFAYSVVDVWQWLTNAVTTWWSNLTATVYDATIGNVVEAYQSTADNVTNTFDNITNAYHSVIGNATEVWEQTATTVMSWFS